MAGFATSNNEHLIRSNLWSAELKEIFLAELQGWKYVKMITDFPDGDTINIPSIGQMEVQDYVEGNAIKYTAMDTGNFTFTVDKYKSSATFITNKMKQDSFYMNQLVSEFVPREHRAIAVSMETDILAAAPNGQTASNLNTINGANHRWVGSGTNGVIDIKDFALARYALQKANVPLTNLVALVDPSVEYKFNTLTNLVNVSNNPRWEGIISSSINPTGMRFIANIYGFDVYVSNYLKNGMTETVNSVSVSAGAGVANLFFSASVPPLVGLVRQQPTVDSEYEKDLQREEYVTTARYGVKLFRPENMVCVLTSTDQVS